MTAANSIHSSAQLFDRAIEIARTGQRKRVSVAAANDVSVIEAASQASNDGFIEPILVGDSEAIGRLADERGIDLQKIEVINERDVTSAAHRAVQYAAGGEADIVMKGSISTPAFLKVVLDARYGLKIRSTLSHCAVLDIPGYHKLLTITDGGVVVKPNREQKFHILENAVLLGRAMGLSPVKVAVSAAYERPTEKLSHAFSDIDFIIPDAMKLLKDVAVQGPLPFDLATCKSVADPRQADGTVVGDADVYLVDSIEEGNIIAKSLIRFAGALFAGVIVGASVPVSLVSRSDTSESKKASLAVACILSDYYLHNHVRVKTRK